MEVMCKKIRKKIGYVVAAVLLLFIFLLFLLSPRKRCAHHERTIEYEDNTIIVERCVDCGYERYIVK